MFDRYRMIQQERAQGNEKGFTLIELLIVIVVLGILAAVTVFALGGVTGQSLTSACNADAKSVVVAQEAYRAQTASGYAVDVPTLVPTYLRTAPGNQSRYVITTSTNGQVLVSYPKATAAPFLAPGSNYETFVPAAGKDGMCVNIP